MVRKQYTRPELIEYGRMDELTLGATGDKPDYIYTNGQLNVNANSPSCTNNVNSGGCVTT